jgi:hypothetical protein
VDSKNPIFGAPGVAAVVVAESLASLFLQACAPSRANKQTDQSDIERIT